ncbi:MAG TPA: alpha-L-fucosidase, partial [Anaerolineae bacterium]|nr:alpha-L-fucosidase [Anaerolineae bacterium]
MEASSRSLDRQNRLSWFNAAKFGLFIHWGPYSVAGVEASWPIMAPELAPVLFGEQPSISEAEYTALPQHFNPVDY